MSPENIKDYFNIIHHQTVVTTTQDVVFHLVIQLPLLLSWRLWIYHFIVSLPLPWIPSGIADLLIALSSLAIWALDLFILWRILLFVRSIISHIYLHRKIKKEKKVFLQLIFPSDTSKSAYATEQVYSLLHSLSRQKGFLENLLGYKKTYSLELVATKHDGIRYIISTDAQTAHIIERSLLSYLPGIRIQEVNDYLADKGAYTSVTELKLNGHFTLPLQKHEILSQHDPIAYLTGNMTKLSQNEMLAFQIVLTPVMNGTHAKLSNQMHHLRYLMLNRKPIAKHIHKSPLDYVLSFPVVSFVWSIVKFAFAFIKFFIEWAFSIFMATSSNGNRNYSSYQAEQRVQHEQMLSPIEQELHEIVKSKIDQPLYEATIRLYITSDSKEEINQRFSGIVAALGPMGSAHQSIGTRGMMLGTSQTHKRIRQFSQRTLSPNGYYYHNPVLSIAEMTDLYHFPYTTTTKTEDMAKVMSPELPPPLILKNAAELDVIFGKNTYGGQETAIGMTDDERTRHMYLLGQTGSGKSTIIFHMAKDDIQKGRGICVIDPHGDLVEDLLTTIPANRIDDVVYINPFDLKHPIGINLLELTPGLDGDELELEKEVVCESTISIFRRIFSKDENVDAHRIEYILRNTIYTAFYVKDATIFTVYDLLTDPVFKTKVLKSVTDKHLQNFWKNEFGKAGDFQVFKMISGVTAKVGRFLFSPIARRILEQPTSTIHFDTLLDEGKIVLCNLSQGKLGEDNSQVLGTTLITKIHQAIMQRARVEKAQRKPFYLYVDEFQNYATTSFTNLLSSDRKYGLRITIAQQSTSQQDNKRITEIILANVGSTVCFRTASPVDEGLMLAQFSPLVKKGDIMNLPRFHFYMKLGAIEPQEPFSGQTLPMNIQKNQQKIDAIIFASQQNYASIYIQSPEKVKKKTIRKSTKKGNKKESVKPKKRKNTRALTK